MAQAFRKIERFIRHSLRGKRGQPDLAHKVNLLDIKLNQIHMTLAESERRYVRQLPPGTPLQSCEFKVFSQFGEDGILQHLLAHIPCPNKTFVEFGVEDFREANCRYLIERESWTGLVMDGDPNLESVLRGQSLSLFRNLRSRSAFITAENINSVLEDAGMVGDIGILSIDIDGNDYWVWKAISVAKPRIVIAEYNSIFGCERAVSIPYEPTFLRQKAHHSCLYMGASLPAMCHVAKEKGYLFVGSNSAGNNGFFVREDVVGQLRPLSAKEGYVESTIRESKDPSGNYTYLEGKARLEVMAQMPLIDVVTGKTLHVGDLVSR